MYCTRNWLEQWIPGTSTYYNHENSAYILDPPTLNPTHSISPSKQSILSLPGAFHKVAEVDQASEPVQGTLGLVRWSWWITGSVNSGLHLSRWYLEGFCKSCVWNHTGTWTWLIYFCCNLFKPWHTWLCWSMFNNLFFTIIIHYYRCFCFPLLVPWYSDKPASRAGACPVRCISYSCSLFFFSTDFSPHGIIICFSPPLLYLTHLPPSLLPCSLLSQGHWPWKYLRVMG